MEKKKDIQISIIIPTLNEGGNIGQLVEHLQEHCEGCVSDLIVSDGGSSDATVQEAEKAGAKVLISPDKGRAQQMNHGVANSSGNILWFVHADSLPPASYVADIKESLETGYNVGCYRFRFDSKKWPLKVNSWFTRFDLEFCRGGDQTLFVTRDLWTELKGYRDDFLIMEEYEFMRRARKKSKFRIIPKDVMVSARKYDHNSYLRVNFANFVVFNMYRLGASQEKLMRTYYKLLRHPKDEA